MVAAIGAVGAGAYYAYHKWMAGPEGPPKEAEEEAAAEAAALEEKKKGEKKPKGAKKGKRITGMEIIRGSKVGGNKEWTGGKILDPKNGKVYSNRLWINPKNAKTLKVRGYVLFFFRTQDWWRVDNKLCG